MLTDEKSTVTLLFENGRERRGEKLQTAAAEREKAVCDFLVGEPSRELSFPEGGRIVASRCADSRDARVAYGAFHR